MLRLEFEFVPTHACPFPVPAHIRQTLAKVNENEKELPAVSALGEAPNTYVFMERYADQAAVEAHRRTEYSKTLGRTMAEYMDGKPIMQRFKQVGAQDELRPVRCQSRSAKILRPA